MPQTVSRGAIPSSNPLISDIVQRVLRISAGKYILKTVYTSVSWPAKAEP